MGDMLELGAASESLHRQIGKIIGSSNIDMLIGAGALARLACEAAGMAGLAKESIYPCDNAKQAGSILKDSLSADDVVLIKGSRRMGLEHIIEEINRK